MEIDPAEYEKIAAEIHSDNSPVGIDAKKTHIQIIHLLQRLEQRIEKIEVELKKLSK